MTSSLPYGFYDKKNRPLWLVDPLGDTDFIVKVLTSDGGGYEKESEYFLPDGWRNNQGYDQALKETLADVYEDYPDAQKAVYHRGQKNGKRSKTVCYAPARCGPICGGGYRWARVKKGGERIEYTARTSTDIDKTTCPGCARAIVSRLTPLAYPPKPWIHPKNRG